MVGDVYDVITCAKFQIEIFMCYDFTVGLILDFLLIFIARQHTDARYWYRKSVRLSVRPSVRPCVCLSVCP